MALIVFGVIIAALGIAHLFSARGLRNTGREYDPMIAKVNADIASGRYENATIYRPERHRAIFIRNQKDCYRNALFVAAWGVLVTIAGIVFIIAGATA